MATTNTDLIYKKAFLSDAQARALRNGRRFAVLYKPAIEFGTAVVGCSIEVRCDTFTAAANVYYAGEWSNDDVSEVGRPLLPPEVLGSPAFRKHVVIVKKGEYPILAVPVRSHSDPRFNQAVELCAASPASAAPQPELEAVAATSAMI